MIVEQNRNIYHKNFNLSWDKIVMNNYFSIALERTSEGLPPLGDKFCQKIVWLMWPPPLNLRAGAKLITVCMSPEDDNILKMIKVATLPTLPSYHYNE